MTVLFLCRLFYPHIGGVEKHVFEISKRLVKRGHKVLVITENYSPSTFSSLERVDGVEIRRFNFGKDNWFKKFRIWRSLWINRKLIEKSDIVHCHDVFFWYLPFRFIYSGKKVFTTFHGFETKFPLSKKSIFIRKISEILSCGNICIGKYIKKWYRTKPTFITYGAIDKKISVKLKDKKTSSEIRILLVGRLDKDMSIKIYLHCLALLKKRGISFNFETIGDGELRKDAENFGIVHGFVNNTSSYILNSDIVFASSYLSMLESFAYKKIVFSVYNNPLKEDYLRMTPFSKWFFIENKASKLADDIVSFTKNKKNKNAEFAYEWVKSQTWDSLTNLYFKLWNL